MKFLIADDDPVSRRLLRQVLTSVVPDCKIEDAANGEETLAALEQPDHGCQVIFLDITMPDANGIDLLKKFKETPALQAIPVVLCTSANDRATVTKAVAAGARHYIVKPPSAPVLAAKLKQLQIATAA